MAIKILAWNCQSLRNKIAELNRFVEKNNIDIILLSETWLNDKISANISSFASYRVDRSHGGVAIFIRKSISHSYSHQISFPFAEAISLKIHDSKGDFTISSIYCSPSASRAQAKEFFLKVLSVSGPCVIAGDFNAKNHVWNSSMNCHKGSDFLKLSQSRLFKIHPPNSHTLIPSRGNPTTVDFALSKAITGVTDPKVINDLSSDHLPILFTVPFNDKIQQDQKIFNFAKGNWKKFRCYLETAARDLKEQFTVLDSPQKINDCIAKMNEKIHHATISSIPKKLPYQFRYPYSRDLEILIKNRNFYRRKFKSSHDPAFRSISNQLNRLIKSKTSELNQKSFDEKISQLDPLDNSLFRFAKSLKNKKIFCPPLKSPNDQIAYTDKDKAEAFAHGFLSCHQTTVKKKSSQENKVKKSILKIVKDKNPFPNNELAKLSDVVQIIDRLKTRKASGPDNISNRVIKNFPKNFVSFLTYVFNSCLKLHYFPTEWKKGRVVAIPKPGKDPSQPLNYRPISLLSNIGKIFERIILDKLQDFEWEQKIFIPEQFGFRNNHSTVQQILRITESASKGFNQNRSSGMVLLDVEKAFDSVWHEGLLHKLLVLKIPIFLTRLIKSYLCDRKSFVEFNGSQSFTYNLPAGVPQGSLLSPFLFNVFINDISLPSNCFLAIYADDTAIYADVTWKNIKRLKSTLESALRKVSIYFDQWKIKINHTKTDAIVFSHSRVMKRKLPLNPLTLNGNQIEWKDSVKYLGVHLDDKLNFKLHIQNAIIKSKKAIAALYPIIKKNSSASFRSKLTIYKSYIRPILTYACPVYSNCPKTHFNKLQIMQNKCLRMVTSSPFHTRITELHSKTKVPYVRDFVDKSTEKFYCSTKSHENDLIRNLGDYTTDSLPFRVKHKMPRAT